MTAVRQTGGLLGLWLLAGLGTSRKKGPMMFATAMGFGGGLMAFSLSGNIYSFLGVPRQPYLPIWRQSVLPVHLLGLAPLLGCISPVAGDVKLQDDGVVHHPVNRRGGGHGVGKDAFPLGEDQV